MTTRRIFAASAFVFFAFLPGFASATPVAPYYDSKQKADVRIKADESTGALTTTVPLALPPGRKGVEPSLSLGYNSRNRENANIMGLGWSVDIPYIERINKYGTEDLFTSYDFRSSFDDELARKESATSTESYGAKVETGAFRKYEYVNHQWWRVTDARGWVYTFGTTSASQIASSTNVYRWMLEKTEDTNGNAVTYEYVKDTGQIYPYRVMYTRSAGDTGLFEVEFTRESRADVATSSFAGFPVASRYRISEIQVKVNNSWVRKYALGYAAGESGSRSLLTSVTETGRDEDTGATLALPATEFAYQRGGDAWTSTHNFDLENLPSFVYADSYSNVMDMGTRVAEVNGDAFPDIITKNWVYVNKGDGTGWTADGRYATGTLPLFVSGGNYNDSGTRMLDVNGDGLDDIIRIAAGERVLHLNKGDGTGWTASHGYDLSNLPLMLGGSDDPGTRILDANGDGLPDFLRRYDDWTGTRIRQLYLNKGDGTGWTNSHNYNLENLPSFVYADAYGSVVDTGGARAADVNGDGLTDIITRNQLYPNKGDGTGWTTDHRYNTQALPEFVSGPNYADTGARLTDISGDGLVDVIRVVRSGSSYTRQLYLNKGDGTGWAENTSYAFGNIPEFLGDGTDAGTHVLDANGDGLPDFLRRQDDWTGGRIRQLYLKTGDSADLLYRIRSAAGATTTVTYKSSSEFTDGNGRPVNAKMPFSMEVVDSVHVDSGFGPVGAVTYTYGGGEYYYNGPTDREFAGFATTTRTDTLGFVTKTFYHQQGSTTQSTIGEYEDHIAKKGRPYRVEVYDASGNLYKKTINAWDRAPLDYQRNFVFLARTTEMTYDGDADHKDKAETYRYDASTGNLAYKQEWGEISASDSGSFTALSTSIFGTTYTYAASGTGYLIALPSQETVVNNASTTVQDTKFYYDSLAHGTVAKGNETKREMWKSGVSWIDTEKTYNTLGLVTQEKDPRDKTTTYAYDAYSLHVATSTDPAGHTTGFVYDYSLGKPRRVNNPHNLIFETTYDALDRVAEERQPDLTTPATLVTKAAYAYTDGVGERGIRETRYLDASTAQDRYTYLDGLNRVIQERAEAEDTNTFAARDFVYDRRGQKSRESLPYFSAGAARTASTTNALLYANNVYDPLDRITAAGTAVGTTSYTYDDWNTTVTDANGNIRRTSHDAYGNLARVEEVNGSETYVTAYEYNRLKNLTKITDAAGNVRNFTYDGLGRRLTAEDLHASGDATFGAWTYAYDDAGNTTSVTDPKSQNIAYTYDDINRMLTEDFAGAAGMEVTYAYDSCDYGKGKTCGATTTAAGINYTYDPVGGIATERHATSTSVFTTTYSRDRQGNPVQITYPDNATVTYAYNAAGMLETVSKLENGTTTAVLIVADTDYGPTGAVTYRDFGNGTETIYTYDANALYRLTNIRTTEHAPDETFGIGGIGLLALDERGLFADTATATPVATSTELLLPDLPAVLEEPVASSSAVVPELPEQVVVKIVKPSPPSPPIPPAPPVPVSTSTPPETATSTPALSAPRRVPIREMIAGKSFAERAAIKGNEIAKIGALSRAPRKDRDIEVVSLLPREGGVEAWVRAWDGDGAVGFGKNGTVEIERIRVFNPPILVDDPEGDIMREYKDPDTGEMKIRRLREDPQEALLQSLEHTISVMRYKGPGNAIIPGKVGSTVSTFYPAAGENEPMDGKAATDGNVKPWAAFMDETGTAADANTISTVDTLARLESTGTTNNWMSQFIGLYLFDTSSLPDTDTVLNATLSIYGWNSHNAATFGLSAVLTQSAPASNNTVIRQDYSNRRTTMSQELGSSRLAFTAWQGGAYNNFFFNTLGRSHILATSTSRFGIRNSADFDNIEPTWTASKISDLNGYFADTTGTTRDPKLVVEHTPPNQAPTAPTNLLTEGETDPTTILDITPEFSAIYQDPDSGDLATSYRIQVATSTNWTTTVWDTGTTTMATTLAGTRSPDISYAGTDLVASTTYYWRIRFSDDSGAEGAWSTGTSTFAIAGSSVHIQDISYTYDAVGNITQIIDDSATGVGKRIIYTYDGLNRLTYASTTLASSTPYKHTFSYSSLGNITGMSTSSATTTYTYAGTGYANPHAATAIGGYTLAYDNNGNLTSYGPQSYTWDYRNRLLVVNTGSATSSYGYDYQGNRVSQISGGVTTLYANRLYSTNGATTTKHIFASNDLIAVVERANTATTTHIIHTDHLGGTTAVTNADGDIVQAMDYYPYGSIRINDRNTTLDEGRKFTGHEYDIVPTLYYMRARYYDSSRGQFASQDPAFWEEVERLLEDPQQLNAYSYARNNPLRYTDPDGRNVKEQLAKIQERINEIREQIHALQIAIGNKAESAYQNNAIARAAMDHPYQAGAVIGVAGGAAVAGVAVATGGTVVCGVICGTVAASAPPVIAEAERVYEKYASKAVTFSNHALTRMAERGVSMERAREILQTAKPFEYFHGGVLKTGYYDAASKTFIGEVSGTGNITTVITNVSSKYISNLMKTIK